MWLEPAGGYCPWEELLARTEVPRRSPGRGPPYWKSQVLRRQVLENEQDCGSHGDGADEAA